MNLSPEGTNGLGPI